MDNEPDPKLSLGQMEASEPPSIPKRLDRVKSLTRKVKDSAKRLFDDGNSDNEDEANSIFEDAAFNPQKILQSSPEGHATEGSRLDRALHAVKDAAKNPRRAITNSVTRTAAAKASNQHHDRAGDLDRELLVADDDLCQAREPSDISSTQNIPGSNEADIADARQRVEQVESRRADLRAAWVIGRHVKRARVVRPMQYRPRREQFYNPHTPSETPSIQWLPFLGNLILWYSRSFTAQYIDDFEVPPFDPGELALIVERLAAISTPWQSLLIEIRYIYIWTDPSRTLRWLGLFLMLWWFQQFITFFCAWMIYLTVANKFHPTNINTVRERTRRAQDRAMDVHAWTELIQKHGKAGWIEPLLDQVGPVVQLQLLDLTNFLEILQNFYRWEQPRKTLASLFCLFCCFMFSICTDMATFVKVICLGVGFVFFFSFPISTHYPKYRHLVIPYYWMFWNVPDAAQLAVIQLQEKTIQKDAMRLDKFNKDESECEPECEPELELTENSSDFAFADTDDTSHIASMVTVDPALKDIRSHDKITFRVVILPSQEHSRLTLRRTGFWIYNDRSKQFHPYQNIVEIQKPEVFTNKNQRHHTVPLTIATQLEQTGKRLRTLQLDPCGLTFFLTTSSSLTLGDVNRGSDLCYSNATEGSTEITELAMSLAESDRDKVFSVVLGWSNLKWQPMFCMNRQNKIRPDDGENKGQSNLDDVIKRAMKA